MKRILPAFILCVFLFIYNTPLQAQTRDGIATNSPKAGLTKIGATFGIGAANMDLKAINSRLQELEIGKLEESLTTFNLGLYTEIHGGLGASFELTSGVAFDSFAADPHAFLSLTTLAFGLNLHCALLNTNRFRLHILGGPRFNDMRLTYNADTRASAEFDDLLTNPTAGNSAIALESVAADETANVGVRFQYRLGKKESIKQHKLCIGLDSGYNFSFGTETWREAHSRTAILNMPVVKPDNFYLNLTFSAHLLR